MDELIRISREILISCMNLKKEEQVLVIADDGRREIGEAFYEAAKRVGSEAMLILMKEREVSGQEPPAAIGEAMKAADVVIAPTSQSLTHTKAKMEAVKRGARIATMPGITKEMLGSGAMTADYSKVERLTYQIGDLLTAADTARIEKDGYVLNIDIRGRRGYKSTGVYRNAGESGNLPSGEAYIAPVEGKAAGEMLIDGSMVGIGKLESPLRVKIEDGILKDIEGDQSEKLGILLKNKKNGTLAELGIGTNYAAKLCGIILEDEKIYGTVHIAFGTNDTFGGNNKAECHLDGIILKPTLYLDGEMVMRDGEFCIDPI